MKNLKIGRKLIVAFGLVMVLFIACIVFAVTSLRTVSNNFTYFYTQSHSVVTTALDMRRAFQSAVKNILRSVTADDAAETESLIESAQTDMSVIQAGLPTLKEKFAGDQGLVEVFTSRMNASIPIKEQIYGLSRANKQAEALKLYNDSYSPLLIDAQSYLQKIGEDATLRAGEIYVQSTNAQTIAIWTLVIAALVSFAAIVILCTYITRSITRPVREVEAAAKNMSLGNLNADIAYTSKDELGSLAESMRVTTSGIGKIIADISYLLGEMGTGNFRIKSQAEENYIGDFAPIMAAIRNINHSLSSTLSQINEAADQVSGGSGQVSSGSQALSQGATEQASSVEELAATINEISAQVKTNAENAEGASRKAASVGEEMLSSNSQMQQMITAMTQISQSSGQIGKIIKTIEDIAFQTNILALNAAVEAARAGAAGKGFAVVADEVRNLASKSAEASKSTSALIESSMKSVANGTKIADDTAKSLLSVVEGVKEVAATVDKISTASQEQANAILQVTQGVDQISSVVQTNSATAEESAAASEELSGQAQLLKNLVGKFRLRDDSGAERIGQTDTSADPDMIAEQSEPSLAESKY